MVFAVVLISLVAAFQFIKPVSNQEKIDNTLSEIDNKKIEMEEKNLAKPELTIDSSKNYQAVLETTEGNITIELDVKNTPITTNNFVYLSRNNFYDNTIFHRVISGFMIQGGDPQGTGRGGPSYRFEDEEAGLRPEYTKGTVAMANAGPDTNGSQFFIMHESYDLSPNYVIFGKVVSGMEVVDKIATANVQVSSTGEMSTPVNPVVVSKVTIIEK